MASVYGGGVHTKHRHTRYHDFFVARVQEGERVLDLGCGKGTLAFDLVRRAGAAVVAVDIDSQHIAQATRRYADPRLNFCVGDITTGLIVGRFDVVVLSNVLEHLPERVAFLRRIRAQIGPSRLLIRVPLYERDWRVPLKRELGVEWRLDPSHETEYTLESLAREMESAGLSISHQEVRWGEIWAEARASG
jgi:SAM-dependent methyltransferase